MKIRKLNVLQIKVYMSKEQISPKTEKRKTLALPAESPLKIFLKVYFFPPLILPSYPRTSPSYIQSAKSKAEQ